MATLKVYSREYGLKKVEEKVKLNIFEKIIYAGCAGIIVCASLVMLNYKSELYSLKKDQTKNNLLIEKKQKDNDDQKIVISNLSSYERVKAISEQLGMKVQKDNTKVVR